MQSLELFIILHDLAEMWLYVLAIPFNGIEQYRAEHLEKS